MFFLLKIENEKIIKVPVPDINCTRKYLGLDPLKDHNNHK
jgi:hypothetical protein